MTRTRSELFARTIDLDDRGRVVLEEWDDDGYLEATVLGRADDDLYGVVPADLWDDYLCLMADLRDAQGWEDEAIHTFNTTRGRL